MALIVCEIKVVILPLPEYTEEGTMLSELILLWNAYTVPVQITLVEGAFLLAVSQSNFPFVMVCQFRPNVE